MPGRRFPPSHTMALAMPWGSPARSRCFSSHQLWYRKWCWLMMSCCQSQCPFLTLLQKDAGAYWAFVLCQAQLKKTGSAQGGNGQLGSHSCALCQHASQEMACEHNQELLRHCSWECRGLPTTSQEQQEVVTRNPFQTFPFGDPPLPTSLNE